MKRASRIVLLLVFVVFLVSGCAAWTKAVNEVTPEQQAQMQANLAPIAPFIPQPYQAPALVVAGWLACVGYNLGKNWWSKKTGGSGTSST